MALQDQSQKADHFRQLHHGPRILVLPNAWDAASARLFEDARFQAIGTTSAGIANALGYPDGESVPRDEMLFMLRRIVHTVQGPVTADIEAGYGDSVEELLDTIRGVLGAGAVGINLEDRAKGSGGLADIQAQVKKIEAIRRLADAEGIPLVINARTDAFYSALSQSSSRLEEAIQRGKAYRDAGADCVFAPFVTDASTIQSLAKAIDVPLNILATVGTPPVSDLERMGVARVSVGSGPHRATMGLTRRIAEALHERGDYETFLDGAISYPDANRLFASR